MKTPVEIWKERYRELKAENERKITSLEQDKNRLETDLEEAKKDLETAQKEKQELKSFLNSYQEMIQKRIQDCEEIINCEDFSKEEKQPYQEEKEEYEAKIVQVVNKIDNWGVKK